MRIEFSIRTTCDFKTRTHGDDYEIHVQAHDDENCERYTEYVSMAKCGEPGLIGYLVALFESAFKTYGVSSYTGWSCGCIPDRFHPDSEAPGTLKKYEAYTAPRKRRYGYVSLRAITEWNNPLPYEPTVYLNPARDKATHSMTQMYFAHEFSSADDYTRESIEEGYAISVESMRFYQKMARIYKDKTGDTANLVA